MYKSDIEIAQSVKMLPIGEIAEKRGLTTDLSSLTADTKQR